MSDKQCNTRIELTPSQIDSGLLGPEDFKVRPYDDPIEQPFHRQRGESDREACHIESEIAWSE